MQRICKKDVKFVLIQTGVLSVSGKTPDFLKFRLRGHAKTLTAGTFESLKNWTAIAPLTRSFT
jgi:hypothetical protein